MFENLSEKLERSFKLLKGQGKITEINVAETLKDVRRALLDADVNYKVAKQFTDTVKAKALGQNVINAIKPSELMVKIVHDELTQLMGGETSPINLSGNPTIILMSGLQGSGKTTFSGKLARKLKSEKGKRPLLVACDVYRPAAIEQLKVLASQCAFHPLGLPSPALTSRHPAAHTGGLFFEPDCAVIPQLFCCFFERYRSDALRGGSRNLQQPPSVINNRIHAIG